MYDIFSKVFVSSIDIYLAVSNKSNSFISSTKKFFCLGKRNSYIQQAIDVIIYQHKIHTKSNKLKYKIK